MNQITYKDNGWLHLQTWRFLWLHILWLYPLSYAVYHYHGPSPYFIGTGYSCVIAMLLSYSIWQVLAYRSAPPIIRKILNKLSKFTAAPIYVVFNLTQVPIKINTHFTDILSEDSYHIRWYQSPEAEFLELSPQAIVSLNFQKKLLLLLLRHIARARFSGVVIQISSETLIHRPPFKTIRTLIQHIDKLKYRKSLPYQVMIYNNNAPEATDAVVLRPESSDQSHPKLWQALRCSFQKLIDDYHHSHEASPITEPTSLDLLMDPAENLLAAIAKDTLLTCKAIHLIGFSISKAPASDNPLLYPYRPSRWPNIISKSAVTLILLSAAIVFKERYDLHERLALQHEELKKTNGTVLTHQLMAALGKSDSYWSELIEPHSLPPLDPSYLGEANKVFREMPLDQQITNVSTGLYSPPDFINPNEVTTYYEKASKLICTLRQEPASADCLSRAMTELVHDWSRKQLSLLENSLLPIDLTTNIEPSIRLNQLDYLLKHPEIIGEHVHARMGLLASMLRRHPNAALKLQQTELQELVESFKNSGSYKAIQYVFDRHSNDKPIVHPTLNALNSSDQRLIDSILPLEKTNASQPIVLQDTIRAWDLLYRSYLPLKGCFPLQQSSSQDCDATQFINFFHPNSGTFDQLWQQHFAHLLANTTGSEPPAFLPEIAPFLSQEILDRYMQTRIIQSVFFSEGQPALTLRFRPEITESELHVNLKLGSKSYHLHANQHIEVPASWNYATDHHISIILQLDQQEKVIDYKGPWAVLRLMRDHLVSGNNYNYLEINELNQTLRLNLVGQPELAPWYASLYDNFELPQQVLNNASAALPEPTSSFVKPVRIEPIEQLNSEEPQVNIQNIEEALNADDEVIIED